MVRFDLPPGTRAKLTKVTPRKEIHGGDKTLVQAVSLRVEMECSGDMLNMLHPNLQDVLLWVPPELAAQQQLEGLPATKPVLRCPLVQQPLKLPDVKLSGYTVTIPYGIGDPLELYVCALGKFECEAKQGGGATIRWSIASDKEITKELIGELCDLEGAEIEFGQVGPAPGEVIDGTKEAFERDHPLFDGDDGPEDDEQDGEGDEPDATSAFVDAHSDAETTEVTMADGHPATLTKRRGGKASKEALDAAGNPFGRTGAH